MKAKRTLYKRKLSLDESKAGYLLIKKDALRMFPEPGKEFEVKVSGENHKAIITPVRCTCMGPDSPHEHYHLPLDNLIEGTRIKRGSLVTLRHDDETFTLELK